MPGYQSSGTQVLEHLANEAKEKKAVEELNQFQASKESEKTHMQRWVEAFSDCDC